MPAAAPTPKRLESLNSAASRLGISVVTLRRRIATGELRVYHLGPRLLRVDTTDVDGLLRCHPESF